MGSENFNANFVELPVEELSKLEVGQLARYFRQRVSAKSGKEIEYNLSGNNIGLSFKTKLIDLEKESKVHDFLNHYRELFALDTDKKSKNPYKLSDDEKKIVDIKLARLEAKIEAKSLKQELKMIGEDIDRELKDNRSHKKPHKIIKIDTTSEEINKRDLITSDKIVLSDRALLHKTTFGGEKENKPSFDAAQLTQKGWSTSELEYMEKLKNNYDSKRIKWLDSELQLKSKTKNETKESTWLETVGDTKNNGQDINKRDR